MKEKLCADLQVVVLVGGIGKRLGALTENTPKPLIKIHDRPFFEYQLNLMRQAGFKKFLFCTGYHSKDIENYFGNGEKFGVDISYSYDGENLKGTGGAIVNALNKLEENFMLVYGDSFMDVNYFEIVVKFYECLKNFNQPALMSIIKNKNRWDKSNVLFENGQIKIYDKHENSYLSQMQYIDYGINIFNRKIFEGINLKNGVLDLADIQNKLSLENKISACEVLNRFYEIGSPKSLNEFTDYVQKRFINSNKAIFLDRDGVINQIVWNENIEQLDSPMTPEEFVLLPNVIEALKILRDKNYLLFIITNQPAAAKGKTKYLTLCEINKKFLNLMRENNIEIADIEMCPHHEKGSDFAKEKFLIHECDCRKPKTGMIENICAKFNIDIKNSWMVGDSVSDIICGRNAELKTAFIGELKCDACKILNCERPDTIYKNILNFAENL